MRWAVSIALVLGIGLTALAVVPSERTVRVAAQGPVQPVTPLPPPVTVPPEAGILRQSSTTTTVGVPNNVWRTLPGSPLRGFAALGPVWTGQELLIWAELVDRSAPPFAGAAYDPATNRWRRIAPSPLPGSNHWRMSAVWTGTEVLAWGAAVAPPPDGYANVQQVQAQTAGARYNPATDSWRPMSPPPLSSRIWHEATWTGKEMIVWGGASADIEHRLDGAAYDPVTDRWRPIASGPFTTSVGKVAVWTGERLILWGGCRRSDQAGEGAIYDPATDRWDRMPPAPVSGRDLRSNGAHWTGREFLFWSGRDSTTADGCDGQYAGHASDGAAYDPATRTWRRVPPPPGATLLRDDPNVHVWTGSELLVFGGDWRQDGKGRTAGAAYDPTTDRWRPLRGHPLVAQLWPSTVWTGRELILWGPRNLTGWGDVYPLAGDDHAAAYSP